MDFESRKEKKTNFQVRSHLNTETIMSKGQLQQKAISKSLFASVSKRVLVLNHSNENKFDLHENKKKKKNISI